MFHLNISHATAKKELADETSEWIAMPEGAVHYRSVGTGPTVVLVHNSGMWGGIWDPWIPILSKKYRVVVPDLRGFGLTGRTSSEDYSYAGLSEFLADFIGHICEGPVHVVGLSLGGQLAWRCALNRPELLKSLILINPTGYPEKALPMVFKLARGRLGWLLRVLGSKKMLQKNLSELWGEGEPPSEAFLDKLLVSQCRAGNRAAFLKFLRTDNISLHDQIVQIQHPVQLQWSAKCGPERFSDDLPNVDVVLHEHLGHLPNLEAPEVTAQAAMQFIEKQETGRSDV